LKSKEGAGLTRHDQVWEVLHGHIQRDLAILGQQYRAVRRENAAKESSHVWMNEKEDEKVSSSKGSSAFDI